MGLVATHQAHRCAAHHGFGCQLTLSPNRSARSRRQRMKQSAIAILLLVVGIFVGAGSSTKGAAAQTTDSGRCIANIPAEWGTLKGVSPNYGLAFEDTSGTLRFVNKFPCGLEQAPNVTLEVRRK